MNAAVRRSGEWVVQTGPLPIDVASSCGSTSTRESEPADVVAPSPAAQSHSIIELHADISGKVVPLLVGLSLVAVIMLLRKSRLTVGLVDSSNMLLYAGGLVTLAISFALRNSQVRWQQTLRDGVHNVYLFTLICILGSVASYGVAAASRGFADTRLERIDQFLHFDWTAWYETVAGHPLLQVAGRLAYGSIFLTPAILLACFAQAGRRTEARLFLITFWVAAVMTLALFPLMPAKGPLAVLWHGPIPYMPASALYQAELIPVLRSHELHQISLGTLRGLVCAPSFHTASAVIYIAAAWPLRRLRWPILILNLAMLTATPVEGTHYFADIIGGAVIGLTALLAVALYARRSTC